MRRSAYILLLISYVALLTSCASYRFLRTEYSKDKDIQGTFTLMLYGSRHLDDIETIAILDIEGDGYS